jgi:hypothetical protein
MSKYNKSEIMKNMWKMVKVWGKSEALKRAWANAKADIAAEEMLDGGRTALNVYGTVVYISHMYLAASGRMGWAVTGNTFRVKKDLKSVGLEWDPEIKCWATSDRATALTVCRKFA